MTSQVPRIAARALVALSIALAALIAVVAFMPGTEVRYYDGAEIRQAGGIIVSVLAIAAATPGLFVWIAATRSVLWLWTAVALVASLALYSFLDAVHPPQADVVWWPARIVETAVWALIIASVLGSYVLGFAVQATEASRDTAAPELAARLRRLVVGIAVLGAALLAVGFLPGQRVYHDANHCVGATLATSCISEFTELHGTYPAGGELRLPLYLLVVLAPAWSVHRAPRAQHAWSWFYAAIAGSVVAGNLVCWLELDFDLLSRTVTLWPARVVELGVVAIQAVLLLGLPLMIARSQPSRVPAARVVRRD